MTGNGESDMELLKTPVLGKNVFLAEGAIVRGDVTIEDDAGIWFNTVIRAEQQPIHIGRCSNVQDNCTIHVEVDSPVVIGEYVSIGHGAVIHGCTIGDHTLIGMGSTILNHAVIGKNCIIGAGSLVTQNTIIPDNCIAFGNPAKVVRQLTEEEIAHNHENAVFYVEEAKLYDQSSTANLYHSHTL